MSGLNILDLNDDCLCYLLNYLPIEDSTRFGQVCRRFRDIYINWAGKRNRQFTLDESCSRWQLIEFCICREEVQTLIIDLDHFDIARIYRNRGCETPVNCFSVLCFVLEGMISLQRLIIKQLLYIITPVEKPVEQILTAVRGLTELKYLEIHAKENWTYDTLWQLSHLEELHLHIQEIGAPVIVKCCKSNRNLRLLHLSYGCVQGNLANIVPHCGNLETLKFGMLAEGSAFQRLLKLPKLRQLIHFGVRRRGSFVPLLTGLAVRPQLEQLVIDGGTLCPEETQQIVRLSGLQHLKCFCSSAECVEKLSQLTELQELYLWMSSRVDISDALLKIISNCRKLQLLRLGAGTLSPSFVNDATQLLVTIRSEPSQQPLQLEIPRWGFDQPIQEYSFRNKVVDCSAFETDSWKL